MLEQAGIVPFAISPYPPEILAAFARKYAISYPLLSDADSAVIKEYGILNTDVAPDHRHYGIPRPGTYLTDAAGVVFDKSFFVSHRERESIGDMLQEGFRVEAGARGPEAVLETAELVARLSFSTPTLRREQRTVLTAQIDLKEGMHVYGQPLPEGYMPVALEIEDSEDVALVEVVYPPAESLHFALLNETLPAYSGSLTIKAHCVWGSEDKEGEIVVRGRLSYQACDEKECYLPQTLDFELPLRFLPHDWEGLD